MRKVAAIALFEGDEVWLYGSWRIVESLGINYATGQVTIHPTEGMPVTMNETSLVRVQY